MKSIITALLLLLVSLLIVYYNQKINNFEIVIKDKGEIAPKNEEIINEKDDLICDDDQHILKNAFKVINQQNILQTATSQYTQFHDLAQIHISKDESDWDKAITFWEENGKKPILVKFKGGWISDRIWEIKKLPNEMRLVIIGFLDAAQGNHGDFSTRIGIMPNHFTGWMGAERKIEEWMKIMNDERIVALFVAQGTIFEHEKLISIPIGAKGFFDMPEIFPESRETLLDNFGSLAMSREKIIKYLNETTFKGEIGQKRTVKEYLNNVYNTKFQISAPGLGFDCWRNTESYIMGVVPVMLTSTIDRSFHGLPVLFVETYKDLNKEFLESQWKKICQKKNEYDYTRITFEYWKNLIFNVLENGTEILSKNHPLKYRKGQRYYSQNISQINETWKYIQNGI